MVKEFFGDPQGSTPNSPPNVEETLEESRKKHEDIERIKKEDPAGWEKQEIAMAREMLLDVLANRGLPINAKQPEKLRQYKAQYSHFKPAVYKLNSLQDIQNFANQQGANIEHQDFEGLVYDTYLGNQEDLE